MIDATCEFTHRNGGFWYARVRYNSTIVYNSKFRSKEAAMAHLARAIEKRNALDGFRFKQPLEMPQSRKTPETGVIAKRPPLPKWDNTCYSVNPITGERKPL
jgi:hypothetical protein